MQELPSYKLAIFPWKLNNDSYQREVSAAIRRVGLGNIFNASSKPRVSKNKIWKGSLNPNPKLQSVCREARKEAANAVLMGHVNFYENNNRFYLTARIFLINVSTEKVFTADKLEILTSGRGDINLELRRLLRSVFRKYER